MRLFLCLFAPLLWASCSGSHDRPEPVNMSDAATDSANTCLGQGTPGCVCDHGRWTCLPADAGVDGAICPSQPPLTPGDNRSVRCEFIGQHCSGGNGTCGLAWSCTCAPNGTWSCAFAEPDPVCFCGRIPNVGDPCFPVSRSCGGPCPTPSFVCIDGHWANQCPADADSEVCPANTLAAIGTACTPHRPSCGDQCCREGIVCTNGRWQMAPLVRCACFEPDHFVCGDGHCRSNQYCNPVCHGLGPLEYQCLALPNGCDPGDDCSCVGADSCSGRVGDGTTSEGVMLNPITTCV